jgi:hypothetical protein
MPNLLGRYISQNSVPNEIPTQTRRSRAKQLRWIQNYKLTSESTQSQSFPLDIPYEAVWDMSQADQRLSKEGDDHIGTATNTANIYLTCSAERSTVTYIHQLRRQAAASAPSDESTSRFRTTISAPTQVLGSTPPDESTNRRRAASGLHHYREYIHLGSNGRPVSLQMHWWEMISQTSAFHAEQVQYSYWSFSNKISNERIDVYCHSSEWVTE